MQELLEAHSFDFQQDCLGESWVSAFNVSGMPEDFSDWLTNLESIENYFKQDEFKWLDSDEAVSVNSFKSSRWQTLRGILLLFL